MTAIIAAFNEADIIGQVVHDLVDQGIRVYLLDHGSTDDTVAEARGGGGDGLIGVERLEVPGFSLEAIVRRKAELAAELPGSWFVNQDADEFRESPWTDCTFHEGIRLVDRLGYNAIDFAVLNFWPTHDRFRKGDDVRAAFTRYEPGGAFDRLQIRCWKRGEGPLDLASTAGHEAAFAGRRVFPLRFLLRHYPIRGQAHGERKVFRERLPRFDPAERERGWHVQYEPMRPGQSFIRDPATLVPYDPAEVRVELALRHRGVEEAEAALAESRRAVEQGLRDLALRACEVEELNAALELRSREKEALASALDARAGEVEKLNADLALRSGEKEALARALAVSGSEVERLNADLANRNADLARLHDELRSVRARLAAVESSLSWRMGAPLRAATRWLRG